MKLWQGPRESLSVKQLCVCRKGLLEGPSVVYKFRILAAVDRHRGVCPTAKQLPWRPSRDPDKHASRLPGRLSGPLGNVMLLECSPVRGTQRGCSAW